MTRHLLRLIWNRKRSNFLIMVEILCAFLVLEGVLLFTTHYANNYRQPLGFSIDNLWQVQIDKQTESAATEEAKKVVRTAQGETLRQLLNAMQDLPQIDTACLSFTGPYQNAGWGSGFQLQGRHIDYAVNMTSDGCLRVMGLDLVRGRWFSKEDDAATAWQPVVVNEKFVREVFGDRDPLNQNVPQDRDENLERIMAERGDKPTPPMRVVGIIREFRQHGEYSTPDSYIFKRLTYETNQIQMMRMLMIKLRPGTGPEFEEALSRRLQDVAKAWSFDIKHVVVQRENRLRAYWMPLTAAAVVAGFLLMMVGLGLTGVVWQNVTQRIREIGLRRAKGARIEQIHQQILGELVMMTSLTLLIGVVLLAQVPLLPLPRAFQLITPGVFFLSVVLSVLAIYLLTIACGWYPARLATKIQPAEALHYE